MIFYDSERMRRKPWDLPFSAEPREVAGLRRVLRLHLSLWGLPEVIEAAQMCVTELVTNVINHVGAGTPTTLAVSMNDTRLRIEVRDPDTRALPTLLAAQEASEDGRGMAIVDALSLSWGVILRADSKVVWCELATDLVTAGGHTGGPGVARAEQYLSRYGAERQLGSTGRGRLGVVAMEEAAIGLIADLLYWLHAHGCESGKVLERVQSHLDRQAER
ncbi:MULTISPECIES: ATP-binding protein [unclassified Streptomyces]|uniref:ATP-binding protein n=1 Tax=unclassified Streptomyces TaxID=2593676 RepID=UPI00380B7548